MEVSACIFTLLYATRLITYRNSLNKKKYHLLLNFSATRKSDIEFSLNLNLSSLKNFLINPYAFEKKEHSKLDFYGSRDLYT